MDTRTDNQHIHRLDMNGSDQLHVNRPREWSRTRLGWVPLLLLPLFLLGLAVYGVPRLMGLDRGVNNATSTQSQPNTSTNENQSTQSTESNDTSRMDSTAKTDANPQVGIGGAPGETSPTPSVIPERAPATGRASE